MVSDKMKLMYILQHFQILPIEVQLMVECVIPYTGTQERESRIINTAYEHVKYLLSEAK